MQSVKGCISGDSGKPVVPEIFPAVFPESCAALRTLRRWQQQMRLKFWQGKQFSCPFYFLFPSFPSPRTVCRSFFRNLDRQTVLSIIHEQQNSLLLKNQRKWKTMGFVTHLWISNLVVCIYNYSMETKMTTKTRSDILEALRTPPPNGYYEWNGEEEDDRLLTAEEMQAGIVAYRRARGRPAYWHHWPLPIGNKLNLP